MKKTLEEFKEFIAKGNVIDMAIGVVMGTAFSAIVTSLVNDMIMPLVGVITGGIDFSGLSVKVGEATIAYGSFINAVVNFLIIALCMFAVMKVIVKLKKPEEPAPEEPEVNEEVQLLTEIRDLLKKD